METIRRHLKRVPLGLVLREKGLQTPVASSPAGRAKSGPDYSCPSSPIFHGGSFSLEVIVPFALASALCRPRLALSWLPTSPAT